MKLKLVGLLLPVVFAASCTAASTPKEPDKPVEPKEKLLRRYEYYYGEDEKLRDVIDYEYYDDNKLKLTTDYDYSSKNDKLYKYETNEYTYLEKQENITLTNFDYDGNQTLLKKSERKFDDVLNPISYLEKNSEDKGETWEVIYDDSYSYKYDSKGNVLSAERTDKVYGENVGIEYAYDDQNRQTLQLEYAIIDEVKLYFYKISTEYSKEEIYDVITTSYFELYGEEEELVSKEIDYYDSNNFNIKHVSYEEDELDSVSNYSYDGNLVVETAMTYSSSSNTYRISAIRTTVYDRDVTKEGALPIREIYLNPSSSTGDCKKAVRNYKYDDQGHTIEKTYASYNVMNHVEKFASGYKEVWIYN